MQSLLSFAERDRRWAALSTAMRAAGYDAVVFASHDYRGHKGALRYVTDFNLYHRYGYAVMRADREPVLVLPTILADVERSRWVSHHRFSGEPVVELAACLADLGAGARIGIAGRDQAMRAGEYLTLARALPGMVLEDASAWFDTVRLRKSAEEMAGLAEAAAIADLCFADLLDTARPGDTERQLGARMLETCMRAGGEDPLFLTMNPLFEAGRNRAFISPPRGRELDPASAFTFSFEMIGPSGYWTEMCRMISFAPPSPTLADTVATGIAAMTAGRRAMRPGAAMSDIQLAAAGAVDHDRYDLSGWSGHSIGQDVMETPLIGAPRPDATDRIVQDMAIAFHPLLVTRAPGPLFYMADIFVIGGEGARTLSAWPLQVFTRSFGISRAR